ncbi:uncharacterized protein LOC107648639 isoform X1 [Arachis ipaensis]|uniref:uncharacterized protein n=1 Tax=Arachis hypogaea TaxID=3818 RepID=UPI0007AF5101|nr:uncharacterized protein LOC107648639 isoform X1 [Arachis ipaensis]XP_016207928.1 uncharacterized protein LOC107648639 isoform X1 [Arachis ipaensis]XP_020960059.1 uncharacterized protein LOC107648639 isoform X1 [Arachis ipaensis]XP_020960060.1 uncharacterized protein LOC107648639 isoform X1 [Arachis ipaensis]XP_020960061.1 uncharacterized protein LOC107648639 isoform X1 [Arachis ipaensis]XP_025663753.1 uncharacterized protein LOC112759145 isoform X1 [Arachis hypogaea]XP_025663754.1 uncharac
MASQNEGTKQMNNEGNSKRKRLRTLSQIESQRSPLKIRSLVKSLGKIQFTSAYSLLKQFQIKREHVLAACGANSSKHETRKKGKMPEKVLRRGDDEGQSKMVTKKITNIGDGEDQIKMPTKNSNEENHLVKMKAIEHEDQGGKKPSRKKVPMKKSKVEGDKVKKLTNKMLLKESNEQDANEEEHKIESLIPAMTLDEFFEKYGISLDENDEEYEYDCDELNPTVSDSSDTQLGTKKKKVRGPTQLKHIHALETQIELTWYNGKPIGPTKTQVQLFSRFLGTLARNSNLVTLLYTNWQAVSIETKTSMLDYAKSKYNIPSDAEPWVIDTIGEAWKQFNKRIKKYHYTPYNSFREMMKNRPMTVPELHFRKLVQFWRLDIIKVISDKNRENRSKQKWNHRMGPVSFELVRAELRAKKEDNEDPSQSEMFVVTRTSKKGETDSGTQETIEHLQNLKEAGYNDDEAVQTVFGKERHGRVRFYGRSVTKSSLKKEKEIRQMQQQHNEVVSTMEKNQNNLTSKLDGLTNLIKTLLQQVNPGMSAEQVQVMIEAAQQSPPDASSAPNDARRSIPPSLGSNHV